MDMIINKAEQLKAVRKQIDALKEQEVALQSEIIAELEEQGVSKCDLPTNERIVVKESKVLDKKQAEQDSAWVALQEKLKQIKDALKPIESKYKKVGRKFIQIVAVKPKEDKE